MKKYKVAILFNETDTEYLNISFLTRKEELGFSPIFDVSENTPLEDYMAIAENLCSIGYRAYYLNMKDDFNLLTKNLKEEKPDVIFNFIEIFCDEYFQEKNIVGLFELLGVPYTGAEPYAIANCQNKIITKKILLSNGIKVPKFTYAEYAKYRSEDILGFLQTDIKEKGLQYPMILKPFQEDGSAGIENESVVYSFQALYNRVCYMLEYFKQDILIEEYIVGREFNVSVFGDNERIVLPISEIDFSEMPEHLHKIVSYQAKWNPMHEAYHRTVPICPAELSASISKKIEEIALKASLIMKCRDYTRVDMRLTDKNEVFVLEVNPNPDLSEGLGFMRSAEAAGYTYSQVLDSIVRFALNRKLSINKRNLS